MAGKSLTITYLADARSVLATQKQIDSGHTAMQSGLKKTGTFFQSAFGITAPLAMAAAAGAVVKFGIDAVHSFEESQRVMAQTQAVLVSTGGAANVTAKDVTDLAHTWQGFTGVQDEAIQSSENLLLTFRDVRNEVGAGNQIFNQAEVAILNMSTALNRGATPSAEQLQSATIQLGKALNDPISGMTALKRVGVSFSESQVKTIKALQESGDLMGAQKLILAELTKEFGGAAKAAGDTFSGQVAKLGAEFDDLKESIGGELVPALEDLVSILTALAQAQIPDITSELGLMSRAADLLPEPLRGGVSIFQEFRTALTGSDNEIVQSTNSIQGWAKEIAAGTITLKQLQTGLIDAGGSAEMVAGITNDVKAEIARLAAETKNAAGSSSAFAAALHEQRAASKDAAAATRDQRLAILGLTNSFLGILDSASQVGDAQKTLTQLQEHGKQGTQAYKDAVLEAIKAQAGLEASVLSYAKELADSGQTQDQVAGKIQNLARHFGLQKGDVQSLIAAVKEYIRQLNNVPSIVHTTLDISRRGAVGVHATQHGFHGMVSGPTLFLAGEAGRERVDITPGSRGGGNRGPTYITVPVHADVIAGDAAMDDFARKLRDKLIDLGRRNGGTAGIP